MTERKRREVPQEFWCPMVHEIEKVSDRDAKEALKEALKEWLDERFAYFGKWSLGMVGAAALVALVYFILHINGWHK